jgi:hypothetical protein
METNFQKRKKLQLDNLGGRRGSVSKVRKSSFCFHHVDTQLTDGKLAVQTVPMNGPLLQNGQNGRMQSSLQTSFQTSFQSLTSGQKSN